jgi:hypothetical protein
MVKVHDYQNFTSHLKEARKFAEKDLYKKAIQNYDQAFKTGGANLDWQEEDSVYRKYVEFTHGAVESDYINFLKKAQEAQPKHYSYSKENLKILLAREDLPEAYRLAGEAQENFPKNKFFAKNTDSLKYAYTSDYRSYKEIEPGFNGTYKVGNAVVSSGGDTIARGQYVSPAGEKNRVVVKKALDDSGDLAQDPEASSQAETFIVENGEDIGRIDNDIKSAGFYSGGVVAVQKDNGNYAYFDTEKQAIADEYKFSSTFTLGFAAVQNLDGKWGIINQFGKYSVKPTFDDIKLDEFDKYSSDSVYLAKTNDVYHIYSTDKNQQVGKFAANRVDAPSYLIAYMDNKGKWGFVDTTGKVVIKPQYDEAKSFEGGLAPVKKGDKWGAISQDNKLRIPYNYNYLTGIGANKQVIFQEKEDGDYQFLRFINL